MRKIKEVLRLHFECGRSAREIARAVQASPTTVGEYLRRVRLARLAWPLPEDMGEAALEAMLFPTVSAIKHRCPEPDWAGIHRQLARKGVTLDLVWQEYRAAQPDGYGYSWFCECYRAWAQRLPVTLRQTHAPGERLFVDYAGQTVEVIDAPTGEIRLAQIFVAVLGASNYTYCEATWTQGVSDWVGAHVRAFEFFGGVCELLVPDNLKSGVIKAHRYEPEINPSYAEMAAHYGVAVLPARARKPRDKAKVEAGVLLVERWILARLRHQRFFSLAELNHAIAEWLAVLNAKPFKRLPGSRLSVYTEHEHPALKPLPASCYEYAEWKRARVGIDYHVEFDGHYYSVPYHYAGQQVDVRASAAIVEVFQRGERIASHLRSALKGRHTTVDAHMTAAHQQVAGWNAKRFLDWAAGVGQYTAAAIEHILSARRHPQQGYRTALGILRLAKEFGNARLEAACQRARALNAVTYRSVHSILKHGLDKKPRAVAQASLPLEHANVRGPDYYH
jgi:transposase